MSRSYCYMSPHAPSLLIHDESHVVRRAITADYYRQPRIDLKPARTLCGVLCTRIKGIPVNKVISRTPWLHPQAYLWYGDPTLADRLDPDFLEQLTRVPVMGDPRQYHLVDLQEQTIVVYARFAAVQHKTQLSAAVISQSVTKGKVMGNGRYGVFTQADKAQDFLRQHPNGVAPRALRRVKSLTVRRINTTERHVFTSSRECAAHFKLQPELLWFINSRMVTNTALWHKLPNQPAFEYQVEFV